jgi:hypothetical protein
MLVRPFEAPDEEPVVALWERCRLVRPWNDPRRDIARKAGVQSDLFLVAVEGEAVVGTVMAGYDGHRGWVNYVAVDPDWPASKKAIVPTLASCHDLPNLLCRPQAAVAHRPVGSHTGP